MPYGGGRPDEVEFEGGGPWGGGLVVVVFAGLLIFIFIFKWYFSI